MSQAYASLSLGTDSVPWARMTGTKKWPKTIYNASVTFGGKPSDKLVKLVRNRRWAEYEGPWSRVGFVNAIYNAPAFPCRVLGDEEFVNHSARASRDPLLWKLMERSFLRAWDRRNNSPEDVGGLFLSMFCNEMLALDLNVAAHLHLAERVSSELVSWLGSLTGASLLRYRVEGQSLLATWDFFNNGAANSDNPLLIRLLSDETRKAIEEVLYPESGWRTVEMMAASLVGWLDTPAGAAFVTEVTAEAGRDAKALTPVIRKHRLLLQSVGEISSPGEYERALIKED